MTSPKSVKCLRVLFVLVLFLLRLISSRTRTENRFEAVRGFDSIQVTRCDVTCHRDRSPECHKACMRTPFVKHGRCPDSFVNVSSFGRACLIFCSADADCPGTEKCCKHSCGVTCKPVVSLETDPFLPPVPENVTASKARKGVHVTWSVPGRDHNDNNSTKSNKSNHNNKDLVLYVLEERHHLGVYFNKLQLGEWSPIHSARNTAVTLKSVLKPGYFYQFRVAAVNVNGSRGFSRVSDGFTLARPPKLQKPKQLRVEEIKERNGTIWGMVRWKPSKSSVPIEKYKILWSYKLDESEFKYNSDSLMTQRTTVPEHRLHYQLKDLMKNKMYYIQVQAITSFGGKTLKSSKAQMVLDTSKFKTQC